MSSNVQRRKELIGNLGDLRFNMILFRPASEFHVPADFKPADFQRILDNPPIEWPTDKVELARELFEKALHRDRVGSIALAKARHYLAGHVEDIDCLMRKRA